jgi:CDP-4-dehydro-6-deoxyglucose reductase
MPGGRFTTHVFEHMKEGDVVRFEGPLGDFSLRESERPIVFVAGATGFAPVKSMVEDAFHRGLKRPIYLYWGVRKLADLYLPDLPQRWARDHENFHFIPVLSDAAPEDNWSGRTGLVHEAILADFPDLAGKEIYACGSVKMVEAIFPSLKTQGAEEGMCFSDAFTVSARSMAFQPKGLEAAAWPGGIGKPGANSRSRTRATTSTPSSMPGPGASACGRSRHPCRHGSGDRKTRWWPG